MISPASSLLIAVTGGSGAGKGWFTERLCRLLGERAGCVQLDSFYLDRSHLSFLQRTRINYDSPDAIDWDWLERALGDCRAGVATSLPAYDFATYTRKTERRALVPRPVIFVDGLWLLRRPSLRALFDLSIYLDTPGDLRCARRLARDVAERGYTEEAIARRLRAAVLPMHARYVEPQKRHADIVLAQPFREAELSALSARLWSLLRDAEVLAPWQADTFRDELFSLLSHHEYCH